MQHLTLLFVLKNTLYIVVNCYELHSRTSNRQLFPSQDLVTCSITFLDLCYSNPEQCHVTCKPNTFHHRISNVIDIRTNKASFSWDLPSAWLHTLSLLCSFSLLNLLMMKPFPKSHHLQHFTKFIGTLHLWPLFLKFKLR